MDKPEDLDDEVELPEAFFFHHSGEDICYECEQGMHNICDNPTEEDEETFCCCEISSTGEVTTAKGGRDALLAKYREASEVTDVTSTGRKRAAAAYPITEGMKCEWANLRFAGGGVIPIVGCKVGVAKHIHHGPDKNTLNNTPENVHRVCSKCHNRWHSINDMFYGTRPAGTEPFIPLDGNKWFGHDGETEMSDADFMQSEIYWNTPVGKRENISIRAEEIALDSTK